MLRSLTLHDWKSFGDSRNRLPLAPLTLLVGPNGSGKSNALDALRFLQGAALDYPLGDVLRGRWEGQREVWPAIRGQVVEAARGDRTRVTLESEWDLPKVPVDERPLEHSLTVDTKEEALLDAERLARRGQYADLDTEANALRGAVGRQPGGAINAGLRATGKGNAQTNTYSSARSLLGQLSPVKRIHPDVIPDAQSIQRAMRSVVFLDIQPRRMRDYRPAHAQVLGTSAENVSPILNAMSAERLDDVVAWLGELCAPDLSGVEFDATKLKEVMFFLVEGADTRISARSVSDGTLRFLGLVTALLTAAPGSLIVIEEPDVGLHPARVHLLARLLEQATEAGDVQVLATTHSPTLLAHLSAESLENVVGLGRDDGGVTVCERLGDMQHFETLRDSRQLDHLVSTGWIERAL